jgi:hypothetical protein
MLVPLPTPAFKFFAKDFKKTHPRASSNDMFQNEWKNMSKADKRRYVELARLDRERYNRELEGTREKVLRDKLDKITYHDILRLERIMNKEGDGYYNVETGSRVSEEELENMYRKLYEERDKIAEELDKLRGTKSKTPRKSRKSKQKSPKKHSPSASNRRLATFTRQNRLQVDNVTIDGVTLKSMTKRDYIRLTSKYSDEPGVMRVLNEWLRRKCEVDIDFCKQLLGAMLFGRKRRSRRRH